jgi:hypothetical protein
MSSYQVTISFGVVADDDEDLEEKLDDLIPFAYEIDHYEEVNAS